MDYHDSLSIISVWVSKDCLKEPFSFSDYFWSRKTLGIRDGVDITILWLNFFSNGTESFRWWNLLGFRRFRLFKNFTPKRRMLRFSTKKYVISQYSNLCRGTLLCLTPFLVLKIFIDKKACTGGREYHDFLSETSCTSVPRKFVEEPFCVWQSFWYRKILRLRGGGRRKSFAIFCQKFSCQTVEKNLRGTLLCFWSYLVSKNVRDEREEADITIFHQKCFASH